MATFGNLIDGKSRIYYYYYLCIFFFWGEGLGTGRKQTCRIVVYYSLMRKTSLRMFVIAGYRPPSESEKIELALAFCKLLANQKGPTVV